MSKSESTGCLCDSWSLIAMVFSLKMQNSLAKLNKLVLLLSDQHQKLSMALAIRLKLGLLVWILDHDTDRVAGLTECNTAMKCGVPIVPGTPGPVKSYRDGEAFIKEYGFPGMHSSI